MVVFATLSPSAEVWAIEDKLGEQIGQLNRKGESKAAFDMVNSIKEDSPSISLFKASTFWHAGRYAPARKWIAKISKADGEPWIGAQELLMRIEYLEGKIDACQKTALALLQDSPDNAIANRIAIISFLRSGINETALHYANQLNDAATAPISAASFRADVQEAMGNDDEAKALRQSVISMLNDSSNLTLYELVAGARALRNISAYAAANQCIQLAQDIDKTDPFMKLEKVRLYRATQGYGVAAATLKQMVDTYDTFPIGFAEWGEVLWDTKVKEEDVAAMCNNALAGDPTLLDARCRLIYYALLKDDWEACETLMAKNFEVNATHRRTQVLQRALRFLSDAESEKKIMDDDPAFARLMSKIMTAKNDYKESEKWATAHLKAEPDSGEAMYDLGVAKFRTGSYKESQSLLEQSLATLPYALQTKNLLQYIDGVVENPETESQTLKVAYPPNQLPIARFAEARGAQILSKGAKLFDMSLSGPLRIQLCNNLNDLPVITDGIPFGCCVDPAHPALTGVVRFEDTVFLWTSDATYGKWTHYRLDEALHRGVVQALVRSKTNNRSPLWLEEGIASYAVWKESKEWAPPNLGMVVGQLHKGLKLPVAGLTDGYLGSDKPFYQVYAPLLIQEWTHSYGDDAVQEWLEKIARGERWTTALESTFGKSMKEIDMEARNGILTRYYTLGKTHEEPIKEARAFFDAGKTEEAAAAIINAFQLNPYDPQSQTLQLDLVEAMKHEKSETYYRLLEATIYVNRSDANMRFELAKWHHENNRAENALNYCKSAVGIRPEWNAPHRLLADIALELEQPDAAYASLAVLHESRPKHVKILERLVQCARALNLEDESTRWSEELRALAPNSSLLSDKQAKSTL
jgi:hypothetical protein